MASQKKFSTFEGIDHTQGYRNQLFLFENGSGVEYLG